MRQLAFNFDEPEWVVVPAINLYYVTIVNAMMEHLNSSRPGKRHFHISHDGTRSYWKDESTFPEWSKFFFAKDGYNSNRKRFVEMLYKSISNKALTENQGSAIEAAFQYYLEWVEEWEESGEKYLEFSDEDFDLIPF